MSREERDLLALPLDCHVGPRVVDPAWRWHDSSSSPGEWGCSLKKLLLFVTQQLNSSSNPGTRGMGMQSEEATAGQSIFQKHHWPITTAIYFFKSFS
jgi:hypothetical protein